MRFDYSKWGGPRPEDVEFIQLHLRQENTPSK